MQLEIRFVFLEIDECLMACVLQQEECETQIQENYEEYQNLEDIVKEIWKEYEDKDGRGSVQEIYRLMKIFKDRW